MDKEELEICIESVLDKEINDLSTGDLTFFLLANAEGEYKPQYANSDILIEIYVNIQNDEELKEFFLGTLINNLKFSEVQATNINQKICTGSGALCFYTLLRINKDIALAALLDRFKSFDNILYLFNYLMGEIKGYFTLSELHKLKKKLNIGAILNGNTYLIKAQVITELIDGRVELIKKAIKGVNVEINRDKEKLIELIKYLSLDDKYNIFLNEVDQFINSETTKTVDAAMISNLRNFFGELTADIAKRISSKCNEDIPKEGKSEVGRARKYLKIKLGLSEKDDKLIDGYIDILHKEGGHAFVSNKEYFRLARNIGIELALFILSKFQNFEARMTKK